MWSTLLSGKISIIDKFILFSAMPVRIYLPCELLQDTPVKSHNEKT